MRSSIAVLITSLAVGLMFSTLSARAAITHTTSNLNLRAGPGTHHRVKAIIPAGARIDIESCGDAWYYMAWAGHVGYVKHQYLMHHVTAEVPPLSSCDSCPQAWPDQLLAEMETVPSDAKGMLCGAGYGLCSRVWSSSRSLPPSG